MPAPAGIFAAAFPGNVGALQNVQIVECWVPVLEMCWSIKTKIKCTLFVLKWQLLLLADDSPSYTLCITQLLFWALSSTDESHQARRIIWWQSIYLRPVLINPIMRMIRCLWWQNKYLQAQASTGRTLFFLAPPSGLSSLSPPPAAPTPSAIVNCYYRHHSCCHDCHHNPTCQVSEYVLGSGPCVEMKAFLKMVTRL